jgi:hypothetical protein
MSNEQSSEDQEENKEIKRQIFFDLPFRYFNL